LLSILTNVNTFSLTTLCTSCKACLHVIPDSTLLYLRCLLVGGISSPFFSLPAPLASAIPFLSHFCGTRQVKTIRFVVVRLQGYCVTCEWCFNQDQLLEELINEVKQLKIIVMGHEKRMTLLEARLRNHQINNESAADSAMLTDPIQVWFWPEQGYSIPC